MAFDWSSFWADGVSLFEQTNMEYAMLGVGPKADFPAAAAAFKKALAWASDEQKLYYCTGAAWVAIAPGLNIAQTLNGVQTFGSIPVIPSINVIAAGDVPLAAYDTEYGPAISAPYIRVREFMLGHYSGTYRIKFDLKTTSGAGQDAYGRIYRNGAAVGTERHTDSAVYVTYSEDIAGWAAGDLLQLYAHAKDGLSNFYVQNFRIYGSIGEIVTLNYAL